MNKPSPTALLNARRIANALLQECEIHKVPYTIYPSKLARLWPDVPGATSQGRIGRSYPDLVQEAMDAQMSEWRERVLGNQPLLVFVEYKTDAYAEGPKWFVRAVPTQLVPESIR